MIKKLYISPPEAGYYPADDLPKYVEKLRKRAEIKPKPRRTDLVKGNIVVVLEGEYASMRVVYLGQLDNYMALCIGPSSVNGIPLFKINERYLLRTSMVLDFKIDVNVKDSEVYESKRDSLESRMDVEPSETELKIQSAVMDAISQHKAMKKYLSTPFTVDRNFDFYELNL
ncbi:60S ribosomal protein L6 [Astathelohania contejeani]|uniref:60S ribosomal protein L6 n=1 Tax=Astathelohania contejeani TaxID=164912 RepID=A0ABQ7HWK2_9MICR|nr:60S ribosomal protein L6 [Thelohania contejeani]